MQTVAVGGEQQRERHGEHVQTGFPGREGVVWAYFLLELMSLSTSQRETSAARVGFYEILTSGQT